MRAAGRTLGTMAVAGTRPPLTVERVEDVVTITLDRPEKRNALALDVMIELTAAPAHCGRK